ncbi:Six-hairpin glycosidase-like protein [Pyrenochaeta sp. MPI-SDFR-AT-0127]|nr:Six-hairpin glycosidase-like protein [Pyrenochaeta sp. MPI-SDFR-AT-0127]
MSNSIISRNQGILGGPNDRSAILQAGFVQKAFHEVLQHYPNHTSTASFDSYITRSVNSVIPAVSNASLSTTAYSLDRLASGTGLIQLYQQTGNETYKDAFEALRTSIDLQPRTAEAGLWYWIYPNWLYLDGMHSFAPFLTAYTLDYDAGNASAVHDLILQLDLLHQHCYNKSSGLLVHGYDASKTAVWANNITGASPHVWGRSLGWYAMALIDTLEILPDTPLFHGAKQYVLHRFQDLAAAIVKVADRDTGAWWQIVDYPHRKGNYIESSASSMFVYSLLKGARLGFLNNGPALNYHAHGKESQNNSYTDVAVRAYEYVAETFVVDNGNGTVGWNGTVAVCSLNSTASYEYYVGQPLLYNSVLGSVAFVLASLEYEKLTA